jgi:hypothetical protein
VSQRPPDRQSKLLTDPDDQKRTSRSTPRDDPEDPEDPDRDPKRPPRRRPERSPSPPDPIDDLYDTRYPTDPEDPEDPDDGDDDPKDPRPRKHRNTTRSKKPDPYITGFERKIIIQSMEKSIPPMRENDFKIPASTATDKIRNARRALNFMQACEKAHKTLLDTGMEERVLHHIMYSKMSQELGAWFQNYTENYEEKPFKHFKRAFSRQFLDHISTVAFQQMVDAFQPTPGSTPLAIAKDLKYLVDPAKTLIPTERERNTAESIVLNRFIALLGTDNWNNMVMNGNGTSTLDVFIARMAKNLEKTDCSLLPATVSTATATFQSTNQQHTRLPANQPDQPQNQQQPMNPSSGSAEINAGGDQRENGKNNFRNQNRNNQNFRNRYRNYGNQNQGNDKTEGQSNSQPQQQQQRAMQINAVRQAETKAPAGISSQNWEAIGKIFAMGMQVNNGGTQQQGNSNDSRQQRNFNDNRQQGNFDGNRQRPQGNWKIKKEGPPPPTSDIEPCDYCQRKGHTSRTCFKRTREYELPFPPDVACKLCLQKPGHYLKDCKMCVNCKQEGHRANSCPLIMEANPENA